MLNITFYYFKHFHHQLVDVKENFFQIVKYFKYVLVLIFMLIFVVTKLLIFKEMLDHLNNIFNQYRRSPNKFLAFLKLILFSIKFVIYVYFYYYSLYQYENFVQYRLLTIASLTFIYLLFKVMSFLFY